MANLLETYLKDKNLRPADFSRLLKCSWSSVHKWAHGQCRPGHTYAWKIHRLTKGEVPITYWGYTIINGRTRRIDKKSITL